MMPIFDVHPLKTRVGDFIAGLKALEKEPITTAKVCDLLTAIPVTAEAVSRYLLWRPQRYARNLIYRDRCFEVLVLCWLPGQRTAIHSHAGQLGWMKVMQGQLQCRNYRFVRSERRPALYRHGSGNGPRQVEVDLECIFPCQADGRVAVVDRRQTTHQLVNLETSRYGSASLHIYSKPIDQCVFFDETTRCYQRQRLEYHSIEGQVCARAPQAASGDGSQAEIPGYKSEVCRDHLFGPPAANRYAKSVGTPKQARV